MKVIEKHLWLPVIVSSLAIGISALLFYFYTAYVMKAYQIHWLFLLFAVIFIAFPFAHQKLHSKNLPHYSFFKWFSLIIIFEASLYAVFIGLARIYARFLPILTPSRPALVPHTMQWLLLHNGLFPWGITALFTISLCYFSYIKKQQAYLSTLTHPILRTTSRNQMGLVVDATIQVPVHLVLGFISSCAILQIAYLLTGIHPFTITYGLQWTTVTTLLILFFALSNKKSGKLIEKMTRHFSPATVFITLIMITAILLTIISTLIIGSSQMTLQLPHYLQVLEKRGWVTIWRIFSATWWLITIPLTSIFMARISNGYRLRTIILGILFLPTTFALINLGLIHWHLNFYQHLRPFENILTLLGCFFLLVTLCPKKYFSLLRQVYFPKEGCLKHRDSYSLFKKIARGAFFLLAISLLGGMYLVGTMTFILSLFFSLLAVIAVLSLFYEAAKHHFKNSD